MHDTHDNPTLDAAQARWDAADAAVKAHAAKGRRNDARSLEGDLRNEQHDQQEKS
ncbi:hypothetical protein [Embleya scabrispora]|uniref:hypothetical protein n=1 Tax=Embleya scabrispora TaxID=159449 RepID=UPI0003665D82|nr:hypothetical protein [Embleya scabrispora]MYS82756.1 hypothetical protein [Streptomyces sp. SID5474]